MVLEHITTVLQDFTVISFPFTGCLSLDWSPEDDATLCAAAVDMDEDWERCRKQLKAVFGWAKNYSLGHHEPVPPTYACT